MNRWLWGQTSLPMTIREECFPSTAFAGCTGYPFPTLSFRAQREIFFVTPFASSFAKPFIGSTAHRLSAIQCFTFLAVGRTPSYRQRKRSLGFARDDDTGYPFPTLSFRAQREIFLALRRSLLLSLKVSHFPLSHIRRYTDVQERSLHFGRDDNEDGALLSLFSCRHAKECLFEAH